MASGTLKTCTLVPPENYIVGEPVISVWVQYVRTRSPMCGAVQGLPPDSGLGADLSNMDDTDTCFITLSLL